MKVIKVKCLLGGPSPTELYLCKKRRLEHWGAQNKGHRRTQEEDAVWHQWERPQEKPTVLTPWPHASGLQNYEKTIFCCSSFPVYGTLLQQPEQTHTAACCQHLEWCLVHSRCWVSIFWKNEWNGKTTMSSLNKAPSLIFCLSSLLLKLFMLLNAPFLPSAFF